MSGGFGFPELEDSGLGNRLVPWAKCLIWCRDRGVPMIAPFWGRGRAGRDYRGFFTDDGYVSGLRRRALLKLGRKTDVIGFAGGGTLLSPAIVTFRGLEHIEPVVGRHREVAGEIWRITRPALRPADAAAPFLALHVRCGDFAAAPEEKLRAGAHNLRQPVAWYVEALRALRRSLGKEIPAVVFSDGDEHELVPVLREPGVTRSPSTKAITDILLISRASALIASRSTFSAWASFLGQVPVIYFPGARPCPLSLIPAAGAFVLEPEWDYGGSFSPGFLREVEDRSSGPSA